MTDSNNTIALLFPGQGSQAVGMGKELAEKYPIARQTFEEADEALDYKLSRLCFEGPETELRLTEITQPAILTVSVAALRVLQTQIPKPCYVAGHSLGEYSAHVASGTVSFADAVRTVRNRGKYMQEAVPVGVGTMAAILGMEITKVVAICQEAAHGEVCEPANINSPEQIVISGNTAAVERAVKFAAERGAKKAVLLPVSAPFHCSLMKPAQDRLEADLNALNNAEAGLSRRVQCGRRTRHRRPTGPRYSGPPGHWRGQVGAMCAPAHRSRGRHFHRSGTGKSSVGIDAADRPLENQPVRKRRGHAGKNSEVLG